MTLGRLEKVDLREIWQTEAGDFTPWLASEDNLLVLSDALQIDLELEGQEQSVGPFRADILCRDTADGTQVLIENQLERTDHTHLGQLLTYAAGLHSVTIVWIAARFTDEHRAALDWLNESTNENLRFFGLEIEVWRIGESSAAPKFNIISKPNDWSRTISRTTQQVDPDSLTEAQAFGLEYWTGLSNALSAAKGRVRATKPHPQNWYQMSIGRTHFQLFANAITASDPRIVAEVFCSGPQAKLHFDLLHVDRQEIDAAIPGLVWQRLPGRKGAKISLIHPSHDPRRRGDWPQQFEWLIEKLESLHTVFADRIRGLNAADWIEDMAPEDAET
ncbi:MAG: DUF4268 domain-containing protein [Pseudomonadota bacterium]